MGAANGDRIGLGEGGDRREGAVAWRASAAAGRETAAAGRKMAGIGGNWRNANPGLRHKLLILLNLSSSARTRLCLVTQVGQSALPTWLLGDELA
jgi:hypothetical protein